MRAFLIESGVLGKFWLCLSPMPVWGDGMPQ